MRVENECSDQTASSSPVGRSQRADYEQQAELILRRCDQLAALSAQPNRIDRFHLTPEHAAANALVAGWMSELGMTTWVDAAGNQCGRLEGVEPGLPALMMGSHIDTVPNAGRYDGPLGVVMALAVVARLRDELPRLPFALEIVAFSDEEGTRFGSALLGSRAVAGTWREEFWNYRDDAGVTLRQAFYDFGLDPDRVHEAARRPQDLVGYLEAHIEQGPELEAAGLALGVVSSIAGARRFHLACLGQARHAGGTPYSRRRDALIGASYGVLDINKIARRLGVIATVGRLQAFPGGVNVVPGKVEFSLDLRAEHDADRDQAWEVMHDAIVARCTGLGLKFVVEEAHRAPAIWCAPWLQKAVADGIQLAGQQQTPVLFSRAGHDAMAIAAVTDIGMLFIRCADGISHHPDEAVSVADVAIAQEAFEQSVLQALQTAAERRPGASGLAGSQRRGEGP